MQTSQSDFEAAHDVMGANVDRAQEPVFTNQCLGCGRWFEVYEDSESDDICERCLPEDTPARCGPGE